MENMCGGNPLDKDTVLDIVSQYTHGLNAYDISKALHVDKDCVYRYLHEYGLISNHRSRIPSNKIGDVVDLYNVGKSIVEISNDTGIGRHTVAKYINSYLHENNLQRRNDKVRRYTIDESFFDSIDTQNKAYILGFLYSDGCNMLGKGTVSISLQQGDRDILERMRKELKSTRPLEFVEQSKRLSTDEYAFQDLWCLKFYSIHMCRALCALGVIPNKSLQITFPSNDIVPDNLMNHFIRGVFDGDGSINASATNITITGTRSFCDGLLNWLYCHNVVDYGRVTDASCHNGVTSVLQILRKEQARRMCRWMYTDADLYLTRKFDRYINVI